MPRLIEVSSIVVAWLAVCGCSSDGPPKVGSNSNWLTACDGDADCARGLVCRCGACTRECKVTADCAGLELGQCVARKDAAARMLCRPGAAARIDGMCLPACGAGECEVEQVCAISECIPVPLPDVPLCADLGVQDAESRSFQDELLALIETALQDGTIVCPDGTAASASTVLRVDSRLLCEARFLAADRLANGCVGDATDSLGRDLDARLALLGYESMGWAESFCCGVSSAQAAFDELLASEALCGALIDGSSTDIGVGVVGESVVVVLASE